MKSTIKNPLLTSVALLLALPTAYFIVANVLNEFGITGPYHFMAPFVESTGGREPLGWNINLVLLFGPVAACILTLFQVLKMKWEFSNEHFRFYLSIRKRWFPLLVAAFSLSMLAVLFIYAAGENCNC